jgi:hypothetical protein
MQSLLPISKPQRRCTQQCGAKNTSGNARAPHQGARVLVLLPEGPLAAQLRLIKAHLRETYFSWIGGFGGSDPCYYRIQSPVIMVETMANRRYAEKGVGNMVRERSILPRHAANISREQ